MSAATLWRTRYILVPGFLVALASAAALGAMCLSPPAYQPVEYRPPALPAPQYAPPPPPAPVERHLTLEQRQRRWWPVVRRLARRYGLDPALVMSLIMVESRFDPRAVSPKGAMGLMQVLPDTAAQLGVSDPLDPRANLEAGIRYLAWLKRQFKGDLVLALAAYNAGPTKVATLGTVPDHRETRRFVVKVLSQVDYFRQNFQSLARR